MGGFSLIASALLIVLLLPVMVAAWEQKRVPDAIYLAIAAAGIGYAAMSRGLAGAMLSAGIGLACLLLVAGAISMIRARWQVRLLAGRHIKLLGAGATWLGASGTAAMILIAFVLFVGSAVLLRTRKAINIRPDFSPIGAISILIVQIQHSLLTAY